MKKIIAIILVLGIFFSTTIVAFAEVKYKGDINGDGEITVLDARRALQLAAEIEKPTVEELKHDMNGDGKFTALDARAILQIVAGFKDKTLLEEESDELTLEKAENIIREEFHRLVNEERVRCGVEPLKTNSALEKGADVRADECHEYFSHTRPDGTQCYSILNEDGYKYDYRYIGENIAYIGENYLRQENLTEDYLIKMANQFFNMYKNSSAHYRNMIKKDYEDTGIGVSIRFYSDKGTVKTTCTQFFGAQA